MAQRLSDYLVRLPAEGVWAGGNDSGSEAPLEASSLSQAAAAAAEEGGAGAGVQCKEEAAEVAAMDGGDGNYECPYCTFQSQGSDAEYVAHVRDHLAGKSFR